MSFEEGPCVAWLHDLLKPHVTQVLVCDPRKNALLKSGNKNDRTDARKLADLLVHQGVRRELLAESTVPSRLLRQIPSIGLIRAALLEGWS